MSCNTSYQRCSTLVTDLNMETVKQMCSIMFHVTIKISYNELSNKNMFNYTKVNTTHLNQEDTLTFE